MINGKLHSRHKRIDGIGSFQAHTGCITQVSESAQVRLIHVAEIHNLASNLIFGLLNQFDSSAVTYPPDQIPNLTTIQKPITILYVQSFKQGLKLLFDVTTHPKDVAKILLVIFIFIILFLFGLKMQQIFSTLVKHLFFSNKTQQILKQIIQQCTQICPHQTQSKTPTSMKNYKI